jgi:hypothetical protein
MEPQKKRLRGVEIYYGVVVDLIKVKNNSSELQAKLSQSLFKLKKNFGKALTHAKLLNTETDH